MPPFLGRCPRAWRRMKSRPLLGSIERLSGMNERRPARNNVVFCAMATFFLAHSVGATPGTPAAQAAQAKAPLGAGTVASRRAARALTRIAAERERCKNGFTFAGPPELQGCDWAAWRAADALLRRSHQNDRFDDLLTDLYHPLIVVLTPGDEPHVALAQQVVITAFSVDLVLKRAAILTGAEPARASRRPRRKPQALFAWVDRTPDLRADEPRARDYRRRWAAIRDADCAVYPVPRCGARLDDAIREMMRDTIS